MGFMLWKKVLVFSVIVLVVGIVFFARLSSKESAALTPGEVNALASAYISSHYNNPSDISTGNVSSTNNFFGKRDVNVIPVQFNYVVERSDLQKKVVEDKVLSQGLTGFLVADPDTKLQQSDCVTVTGELIVTREGKVVPHTYYKPCE